MRSHVEKSKKYELDKYLITKIYNKQEKKKRVYNVVKKNVVYDKQLTEQYYKYSNNNRNNYYSSYQSFRDYISSGYNYEFLENEINNIKSILGFSRNIREIINKKITLESLYSNNSFSNSIQNQDQIIELNEESSNEKINKSSKEDALSKLKQSYAKQPKSTNLRRASTVFQVDKENPYIKKVADFAHKNIQLNNAGLSQPMKKDEKKDFLDICKLLKIKEEEIKRPQNQYQFRLFSVMTEDFDPFFLPVYENFVSVKYENQKTKLIKLYNKENAFVKCVTIIKDKLKSHLNKEKNKEENPIPNPNVNQSNNFLKFKNNTDMGFHTFLQHKFQIKIPYINAFYLGRTEIYFKDIDNFMSYYKENTSLSTKKLEKDFFANLFKILTYNNADYKKFLQYLYSHSYFFKYIYNYFTFSDKNAGMTIKNIAPTIKRIKEVEPFLNESQNKYFDENSKESEIKSKADEDTKSLAAREKENIFKKTKIDINKVNISDKLLGSEFIYTISLYEEDLVDIIKNKKKGEFIEILSNDSKFNNDYIITLDNSNNDNILQIINVKATQKRLSEKNNSLKINNFMFSFPFDDRLIFIDLTKDLRNNIKIDKNKMKKDKFLLVCLKNEENEYSQVYMFKLTKSIFLRFISTNSLKDKISKNEIFEEKEGSEDGKFEIQYNLGQTTKKEDVLGFNDHTSENESIQDKKEKIKSPSISRTQIKALTFGIGKNTEHIETDKNDEEDEAEEKEGENKSGNYNKDSSEEARPGSDEDSDDKSEDEEDEEDEEDKNDSENEDDDKDDDDNEDDDEKNDDDDDNDEKSENNKEENSSIYLNKNNNEEEVNNIKKIDEDKEDDD